MEPRQRHVCGLGVRPDCGHFEGGLTLNFSVKSASAVALTLFTGALLGSAAQAQDSVVPAQKKWRIKVGGYLPEAEQQQRALGQYFLAFGLGYDLGKTTTTAPLIYEVYFDILDRAKNSNFGRTQFQNYGLGLAGRYLFTDANQTYRPYAGAGVGLYYTRLKQDRQNGDFSNRSRTSIGGKFLVGVEHKSGLFGDLEYNFLPRPKVFGQKINLDGFQLRLGYRFY